MLIAKNIRDNIFRIGQESFIYIIKKNNDTIIIDTGNRKDRQAIEFALKAVVNLEEVTKVIFTHLHADAIGNFDLFPKASLYASEVALADFKANPIATTLDEDIAQKFRNAFVKPMINGVGGLEVIPAPGHTMGSIVLFEKEENILFTGDTYFGENIVGTTDHPTSSPTSLKETILYLQEHFPKATICPMRKIVLEGGTKL